MSVKVKICGITNLEDAQAAITFGADALGFNLWPGSKRYIQLQKEREWIQKLPASVLKIAVLVNPSFEEAQSVQDLPFIDLVQFHGDEDVEFCSKFANRQKGFIKAIALRDASSCGGVDRYQTKYLLLDAYAPGVFGGTGKTIDWRLAASFVKNNPGLKVFLSGGLTPGNVEEAISMVNPYGVDIASGVERSPGRKDHQLLKAFISAVKAARGNGGASREKIDPYKN